MYSTFRSGKCKLSNMAYACLCSNTDRFPKLWTERLEQYLLVLVSMRLGQGFSSLQTLFHAVRASLPSILNVSAIFMMVMCLFAMLFMEFFGLTRFGPYGNDHANFRSYGNSLLTLVRMTTGENWVKVFFIIFNLDW